MSHHFDPTILREYDIRGIVGQTLSTADARAVDPGTTRAMALSADQLGMAVHRDQLAAVATNAELARHSDALKSALRYVSSDGRGQQAIVVSSDVAEYERGSSGELARDVVAASSRGRGERQQEMVRVPAAHTLL